MTTFPFRPSCLSRAIVAAALACAAVPAAFAATTAAEKMFMVKAAGGGLYEVQVSKLATEKGESADVKKYAQMLVDDHTKANDELKALADARKVKLPPKPPADKVQRITRLETMSGAAFDRAYVKQVGIGDHQADIKLFEKGSRDAKDAELKAWIDKTLPTLRHHLEDAQKMSVADPATQPVTGAERAPMNAASTRPTK